MSIMDTHHLRCKYNGLANLVVNAATVLPLLASMLPIKDTHPYIAMVTCQSLAL